MYDLSGSKQILIQAQQSQQQQQHDQLEQEQQQEENSESGMSLTGAGKTHAWA